MQRLDQLDVRRLERLAFLFEMAWDFYQLENSLTIADIEPEHHHQQEHEMKGLFSAVKRFWNEIEAVYNPRLVAISDHGIIIDWVDERTGEKPWFS